MLNALLITRNMLSESEVCAYFLIFLEKNLQMGQFFLTSPSLFVLLLVNDHFSPLDTPLGT